MIVPHSRPSLSRAEERAAAAAIRSGILTDGQQTAAFESEVASFSKFRHAVAVSSGTTALTLLLKAISIRKGERVLLPAYCCEAVALSIRHAGGRPEFVDVDPKTLLIDPSDAKRRRGKTLVLVHPFGLPADPGRFRKFRIIEDCAHRLEKRGAPLGFTSTYATKLLTTGEGGLVLSDEKRIASRVRDLRSYDEKNDETLRHAARMTEMQAAIGRVQLGKLPRFLRRRGALAARYRKTLPDLGGRLPADSAEHHHFRFIVDVADPRKAEGRFQRKGVRARRPVHHLPKGITRRSHPGAFEAFRRALSIPLYPDLSEAEVKHVLKVAKEIL